MGPIPLGDLETVERSVASLLDKADSHGLGPWSVLGRCWHGAHSIKHGDLARGIAADQTVGIDLPLKALFCEDAVGKTWVSYNDPEWIAKRHGLGEGLKPIIGKMREVIGEAAKEAAGIK